ncbi:MAG: hypothetical protein MJ168_12960 [Clostridia bacterium]|nr:hypothetical protein [Clostridia bacterium]
MLKLPSSPITDFLILLLYILPDLRAVDTLIARNRKISKSTSAMQYKVKGNTLLAEKKSDSEQILLRFDEYRSIPPPKLIVFLLWQINKLAIVDANIVTHEIEFNIQELVQCGMYKSVTSAKTALQHLNRITDIYFRGTVKCEESKTVNEWQRPIQSVDITKRKVTVNLNPDFPWEMLTRYYMQLPEEAFSLSRRAFLMMYYCCYLARQNTSEIKHHGSFSILLRTVQYRLNLPDEGKTTQPKKLIKNPIADIVNEINSLSCGIKLKLFADADASSDSFLDNGKINVYFDRNIQSDLPDMKQMKRRTKKK